VQDLGQTGLHPAPLAGSEDQDREGRTHEGVTIVPGGSFSRYSIGSSALPAASRISKCKTGAGHSSDSEEVPNMSPALTSCPGRTISRFKWTYRVVFPSAC